MAEEAAQNNYGLEWSDDSSDESWGSSLLDGEFSDDEDLDNNEWREVPLRAKNVEIKFDTVDKAMVENYFEEKTQIKARLKEEVESIRTLHHTFQHNEVQHDAPLTANEIMNCFFSPANDTLYCLAKWHWKGYISTVNKA